MLPIPVTRAQQARLYLRIRTSFDLSDENPTNSEEAAKAAIAEAISHHTNGIDFSLAEVFATADAVLLHRDKVACLAPAIYDLDSLSVSVGSRDLACLAIKLCGAHIRHPNRWQDDGDGVSRPVLVDFPESFLTDFLCDWSERA